MMMMMMMMMMMKIEGLEVPRDIMAIPVEISIKIQKWLFIPMYRNPRQDPIYFADNLSRIIDK